MAKQQTHYIVGRTVRVFIDPITRQNEEDVGRVKKILQTPEQTGVAGQYRVEVTFGDDHTRYSRLINVGDVFGV